MRVAVSCVEETMLDCAELLFLSVCRRRTMDSRRMGGAGYIRRRCAVPTRCVCRDTRGGLGGECLELWPLPGSRMHKQSRLV